MAVVVAFISRAISTINNGELFCYQAISSSGVVLILPGYLIRTSLSLFSLLLLLFASEFFSFTFHPHIHTLHIHRPPHSLPDFNTFIFTIHPIPSPNLSSLNTNSHYSPILPRPSKQTLPNRLRKTSLHNNLHALPSLLPNIRIRLVHHHPGHTD